MPILPEQKSQRDIDYENYGETGHPKHPTYYNKPTPAMQLISQTSQFTDQTRASLAYKDYKDVITHPECVPTVPTTWDSYYDPNHPDADWTGLVSKNHLQKKHTHNHSSLKENIMRTEQGIVSREERQEYMRKRAPEDPSIIQRHVAGSIHIGGIDNPGDRWKTSHQRFDNREPTSRDQLTLEKRVNPVKKVENPYQARSQYSSHGARSPRFEYGSLSGHGSQSQAMASFSGCGSLLSGIADKLAPRFDPHSRATGTGAQQKAPGAFETNKLLVADNYRHFPPGILSFCVNACRVSICTF
ncbi:hypothetical protein EON65_30880 [archaeon]|nr:MAG: hypothetical protein EON65_30880 [archaeon]